MRFLSQAKTMKKAGLAGCLTAAASLPQLALSAPPGRIGFLLASNLWAAFFLWSFVFAWHERESHRKVFTFEIQPRFWLLASVCGLSGAVVLHFDVDPLMHHIKLTDFPTDFKTWTASTLFTLAFEQLFACFAPFAFFIRLSHRRDIAFLLTVLFGVLILCLKLSSIHWLSPSILVLELLAARMVVATLSLYFYLRGGVFLFWWWCFLLQTRHLANWL